MRRGWREKQRESNSYTGPWAERNRYSNYPLAEFFLEEGYNVITYDQKVPMKKYGPVYDLWILGKI